METISFECSQETMEALDNAAKFFKISIPEMAEILLAGRLNLICL